MGQSKRRHDAIARGESDPGASAPSPTTTSETLITKRPMLTSPRGSLPITRSQLDDAFGRKAGRPRRAVIRCLDCGETDLSKFIVSRAGYVASRCTKCLTARARKDRQS